MDAITVMEWRRSIVGGGNVGLARAWPGPLESQMLERKSHVTSSLIFGPTLPAATSCPAASRSHITRRWRYSKLSVWSASKVNNEAELCTLIVNTQTWSWQVVRARDWRVCWRVQSLYWTGT